MICSACALAGTWSEPAYSGGEFAWTAPNQSTDGDYSLVDGRYGAAPMGYFSATCGGAVTTTLNYEPTHLEEVPEFVVLKIDVEVAYEWRIPLGSTQSAGTCSNGFGDSPATWSGTIFGPPGVPIYKKGTGSTSKTHYRVVPLVSDGATYNATTSFTPSASASAGSGFWASALVWCKVEPMPFMSLSFSGHYENGSSPWIVTGKLLTVTCNTANAPQEGMSFAWSASPEAKPFGKWEVAPDQTTAKLLPWTPGTARTMQVPFAADRPKAEIRCVVTIPAWGVTVPILKKVDVKAPTWKPGIVAIGTVRLGGPNGEPVPSNPTSFGLFQAVPEAYFPGFILTGNVELPKGYPGLQLPDFRFCQLVSYHNTVSFRKPDGELEEPSPSLAEGLDKMYGYPQPAKSSEEPPVEGIWPCRPFDSTFDSRAKLVDSPRIEYPKLPAGWSVASSEISYDFEVTIMFRPPDFSPLDPRSRDVPIAFGTWRVAGSYNGTTGTVSNPQAAPPSMRPWFIHPAWQSKVTNEENEEQP